MSAYVDVEGPLRDYLRAAVLQANGRVYLGTPKTQPTVPWVTLALVNAVPDSSGGRLPMLTATVQIDTFAKQRQDAATLAALVVDACQSAVNGTPVGGALVLHDAQVRRWQWFPDPQTAMPRYSMDVDFLVTAATVDGNPGLSIA